MTALVELLKAVAIPGSLPFLLIAATIGVALCYGRGRTAVWGRRLLTAVIVISYWIFSTPLGAEAISWPLRRGFTPLQSAADASGATAIVVLTGGSNTYWAGDRALDAIGRSSALRALEAARVYDLLGGPVVVVSGGRTSARQLRPEAATIADALVRVGVPTERILLEATSRNTFEHAQELQPLLRARGIDRFVLVTSPEHMRRALQTFRKAGLAPTPSIARAYSTAADGWRRLRPDPEALSAVWSAFHDYFGLAYYWARGRL